MPGRMSEGLMYTLCVDRKELRGDEGDSRETGGDEGDRRETRAQMPPSLGMEVGSIQTNARVVPEATVNDHLTKSIRMA